ncbi:glycosyltransferase [Porticoccus sp. GXU_MW_L64]
MKRVLHAIETGGPGGAENFMIRLVEKLADLGWENTVFLLKEGWLSEQLISRGIDVLIHRGSQSVPSLVKKIVTVAKELDIDVIHSHEFLMNSCVGLASPWARAKVITTVHGKNYYGDKLQRRLLYRVISRVTDMVAVSEDIKSELNVKLGIPLNRIKYIANGVDVNKYRLDRERRNETRSMLGLSESQIMILAVGNLYPVKGHQYLLEAISLLGEGHEVRVFIAGRGDCEDALLCQIEDLELDGKVTLLGFREDVSRLLEASDVFCMPSVSEGMPLSILEAMAASKPVISTNVGGVGEVIDDGVTGFLVPPKSSVELAEAIKKLVNFSDKQDDFGKRGFLKIKQEFDIKLMLDKYIKLYCYK